MATPFKYEYRDTPIHNLNPASKLILFSAYLFVGQIYLDPKFKLVLLASLLIILRMAKVPVRLYMPIMAIASFATLIGQSYTAITQLDPNLFKVYDRQWVSTVILELTPATFPVIGRTAVTYGALLWLSAYPLQVIPVLLAVAGLLYTTSLSEIVSVLARLRMPFPIIFMTQVGLKFVPEIVENIRLIQRAQSLRGWTSEGKNPIKKITQLKPLLVPLVRGVIQSVDVITMSSKNRAFGLGPVTPMVDFRFKLQDKIVCIGVIVILIVLTYASIAWNVGAL